jgi:hypothetical protein
MDNGLPELPDLPPLLIAATIFVLVSLSIITVCTSYLALYGRQPSYSRRPDDQYGFLDQLESLGFGDTLSVHSLSTEADDVDRPFIWKPGFYLSNRVRESTRSFSLETLVDRLTDGIATWARAADNSRLLVADNPDEYVGVEV